MNKISIAVLLMLSSISVFASGPYPPAPAESVQLLSPATILKEGFAKLRTFFVNGRPTDVSAVERFVNLQLAPYFDFEYMTKWAAGSLYRKASAAQKSSMQKYLRQSFLATLVKSLASYDSREIRVSRLKRGRSDKEVIVAAWILRHRGNPTKVNFRFYFNGTDWKVFDITANGNSAVIQYRRHFKRQFRRQRFEQRRAW